MGNEEYVKEINQEESSELDLMEVFYTLLGKLWLILLVGIVCAGAAYIYTSTTNVPMYSSTTKIYLATKTSTEGTSISDIQNGTLLTKDYAQLVVSRPVMEQVIAEHKLSYGPKALAGKIAVTNPEGSRILHIQVTDSDPVLARDLADSVRVAAVEQIMKVIDLEAVTLVENADLPIVALGNNINRNTAIAGILGMLVVCGILILKLLMNDTISSVEDVEKYLNLSVLGSIPVKLGEQGKKKKGMLWKRRKVN